MKQTEESNRSRRWRYWCFSVLVSVLAACDEPFPPYEEPENILEGVLTVEAPDTVTAYRDTIRGDWTFGDRMVFRIEMMNVHDDLLQGEGKVNGVITVQSFAQIPRTILIRLNTGNLVQPPVFQGNIAIPPGEKAKFQTLWIPIARDGKPVWAGLPFASVGTDTVYGPIDFIADAEVQLFERVQAIRFGHLQFRFYIKTRLG